MSTAFDHRRFRTLAFPCGLGAIVLLSHAWTRAPLYFADGPRHLQAIRNGTYVIQPPGYWLFNRLAAMFANPEQAIAAFNLLCAAAGAVLFYYCARRLLATEAMARQASIVYGFVFFAWFSADVHSTYASQLLFPVAMYYLLLQFDRTDRPRYLYGAAAVFGVGAGLRPSDGAFLLPFFCWWLLRSYPRRHRWGAAALAAAICVAWLVPTAIALAGAPHDGVKSFATGAYVARVATWRSVLARGLNAETVANVARVAVALAWAFWPLALGVVFSPKKRLDARARGLWLWIAPGLAFFLLSYFADAPYLNYMIAPVLLLAFMELERCGTAVRRVVVGLCLAWNIGFFLWFQPIFSRSLAANTVNCYAGRFTWYSLRHRSFPNLSDVMREGPQLLSRETD